LFDHRMWIIGGYDNVTTFHDVYVCDLGVYTFSEPF